MNQNNLFKTVDEAPHSEQIQFWRKHFRTAVIALAASFAGAGAVAYNQRDGGTMDLHSYIDGYVERAVRKNPLLNKEQFRAAAVRQANLYENGKVGALLMVGGLSGLAALAIRRKIQSIEAEQAPKPKLP